MYFVKATKAIYFEQTIVRNMQNYTTELMHLQNNTLRIMQL